MFQLSAVRNFNDATKKNGNGFARRAALCLASADASLATGSIRFVDGWFRSGLPPAN
jgi:hypothetical protein